MAGALLYSIQFLLFGFLLTQMLQFEDLNFGKLSLN